MKFKLRTLAVIAIILLDLHAFPWHPQLRKRATENVSGETSIAVPGEAISQRSGLGQFYTEVVPSQKIVKITVRIALTVAQGVEKIDEAKQRWSSGVDQFWDSSNNGLMLEDPADGSSWNVDYAMVFTDNSSDAHILVDVPAGDGRANTLSFPETMGKRSAAHEFGHYMGFDDRYYDDGGPTSSYDHDIMAGGDDPSYAINSRHFQAAALAVEQLTGSKFTAIPSKLGGIGGDSFSDQGAVDAGAQIRSIMLRGEDRLDKIEWASDSQVEASHGGDGGSPITLNLSEDEFLVKAEFILTKSGDRVSYLKLTTNKGNSVEAGNTGNRDLRIIDAPEGKAIRGFSGRADEEIDSFGLIYGDPPANATYHAPELVYRKSAIFGGDGGLPVNFDDKIVANDILRTISVRYGERIDGLFWVTICSPSSILLKLKNKLFQIDFM